MTDLEKGKLSLCLVLDPRPKTMHRRYVLMGNSKNTAGHVYAFKRGSEIICHHVPVPNLRLVDHKWFFPFAFFFHFINLI